MASRSSFSPRGRGRDEGWSNAALLAQLFEGVFDDGFVEAHGGDGFTRRRGDAEVGRLLTMRWKPSLSVAAPKLMSSPTWRFIRRRGFSRGDAEGAEVFSGVEFRHKNRNRFRGDFFEKRSLHLLPPRAPRLRVSLMRPSLSVAAPKVELQNMDAEAVGGTCRRGLLKRWYPFSSRECRWRLWER